MVKPPGLYDHESASIVCGERNLQTPFNSLIIAVRDDRERDSRSPARMLPRERRDRDRCDSLIVAFTRSKRISQLHRHQCGNGEAYRHSSVNINRAKFYHPVHWEVIQTLQCRKLGFSFAYSARRRRSAY